MATLNDYINQGNKQAAKIFNPVINAEKAKEQPLIDRYQATLGQITANQQAALTGSDRTTSQEFERRGILGGGIVDETLESRRNPIRQQFAGYISENAADRERSLADLRASIAALRGDRSRLGYDIGNQRYQTFLTRQEADRQRKFQAAQNAADRAASMRAAAAARPAPSINIPTTQKIDYKVGLKDDIRLWLSNQGLKGATFKDFVTDYAPYLPLKDIYSVYNSTAGKMFGAPKEDANEIKKLYSTYRG